MSRRRRPADVCRVLGRCASRQLSPGPRCFLLRLFGVGQQRVDGAAAPLGGRCLAAPAGQVGRGHGRARADPSASPPAGDDACSFPSAACGWRRPARTGRAPHDRPSGVLGGSVSALRRGTGRRRCSRVRKAATGSRRTLSPGFVPPLRVKTSCPGAQFLRFRARRGAKMSSSPWPPNALRRHHMLDDGIRMRRS